jgi:HSP20 family molecular chaperone IbpA
MSLFPRSFVNQPTTSFSPLFNFLNEYDDYHNDRSRHHQRDAIRTFSPKFDVKETANSFELHGELPGIEQQNIEIEFTDNQTITVKGRTERSYTGGTPIEGINMSGAITDGTESETPSHKATVEDDGVENTTTTVDTRKSNGGKSSKAEETNAPEAKYWVSERSVGAFSRSFTFPGRVDQDNVRASMKNGILSVVVPKAKKPESRKIAIN